jgi:hypothetical protein
VSEAQRLSAERQLRTAIQTGRVWDASLQGLAQTAIAVDAGNFGSSIEFLRATGRAAGVLASVADAQDARALSAEERLEAALERYGLKEPVVLGMTKAMNRLTRALDQLETVERGASGAMGFRSGRARVANMGPSSIASQGEREKGSEDTKAMRKELEELTGYMRELVKINIKQERTLKEIELQGETA